MSDIKPQGTQAYGVESGYESADANIKSIVSSLGILMVSVFVVMAAMLAMFNYFNHYFDRLDAANPIVFKQTVVPPEPHLLPLPYTDELKDHTFKANFKAGIQRTPDGFPWDKRNLEIVDQYAEANSYKDLGNGHFRIPISVAMDLDSHSAKGTPSAMAWQPEYPRLMAGTTKGTMNTGAASTEDHHTFEDRPSWESPDERFTVESTGGTDLKTGGSDPNHGSWSR